jgi:2-dehydro-3-deoxyphosphogluconate aldolase/(4S)-4-hydroxy-2-oxoglutarate aldolase
MDRTDSKKESPVVETTLLDRVLDRRIIAVVRTATAEDASRVIDALAAANISIIEITLTTPGALELIEHHARRDDLLIGAGTVLDIQQARSAITAGARFYASPLFDPDVLELMKEAGCVTMPGAFTPTEIHRAWQAGADLVKLFPMPDDGPRFIRTLRGPLPEIRFAPSGGVTPQTASLLLQAGAAALNVGTWLTHEKDGRVGTVEGIGERAGRLVEILNYEC